MFLVLKSTLTYVCETQNINNKEKADSMFMFIKKIMKVNKQTVEKKIRME